MESQLGEEHETLPDAAYFPTPQRLMCHVDGAECEVLARIMPALENACDDAESLALSLAEAKPHLPCGNCREPSATASRLRGTRLGRRERVILLSAAASEKKHGTLVCTPTDARAIREAQMRAARTLARTGLIWAGHKNVEMQRRDRYRREGGFAGSWDGQFWYWKADVMARNTVNQVVAGCTPFGAEIKKRYSRELVGDKAIRWDKRVHDAAVAAREDTDRLFARFKEEMREYHVWISGLLPFMGRKGQPNPKAIELSKARRRVVDALEGAES